MRHLNNPLHPGRGRSLQPGRLMRQRQHPPRAPPRIRYLRQQRHPDAGHAPVYHAPLPGVEAVNNPLVTAGVIRGGKGPRVEQQARSDYHGALDGELDVSGQAEARVRGEGHDEAEEDYPTISANNFLFREWREQFGSKVAPESSRDSSTRI